MDLAVQPPWTGQWCASSQMLFGEGLHCPLRSDPPNKIVDEQQFVCSSQLEIVEAGMELPKNSRNQDVVNLVSYA